MSGDNAIEVVAKWGGEENGIAWAKLEYYMEKNPRQTAWRRVPGVVVGKHKSDAMSKAEAIAKELSDLNIEQLQPAVRRLFDSKSMYRQLDQAGIVS